VPASHAAKHHVQASLAFATGVALTWLPAALHAQTETKAPFSWTPGYTQICQANGTSYPCRVIADGPELYANIRPNQKLFHFSLIGRQHPCKKGQGSCGVLLMSAPNNGRDGIHFADQKTAEAWTLTEINNALGGPNEHLRLMIPAQRSLEPSCTENGKKKPCIILTNPQEMVEGFGPPTNRGPGHNFQVIDVLAWRGRQSYDSDLYQASGPSQPCATKPYCQTGKMLIHNNKGGYPHVIPATYQVTKNQWIIWSALGPQLIIDLP
jgi:hypothetical protein